MTVPEALVYAAAFARRGVEGAYRTVCLLREEPIEPGDDARWAKAKAMLAEFRAFSLDTRPATHAVNYGLPNSEAAVAAAPK